jgi:hypothetical protein
MPLGAAMLSLMLTQTAFPGQQPAAPQPEPADAQQPQVEQQLGSNDPRIVAWGAYRAGVYALRGTVPLLQRILESPPAATGRTRSVVVDAVLDALIQLHAHLQASSLSPYTDDRPVQSLLLLAQASDRDPMLVDFLTTTSGLRWYAAANMLLRERSPELTAHLLETLHLNLTISVSDSDLSFGSGSGASAGIGCGIGENPVGYPPRAIYRFEPFPDAGAIVLVTGPHTVYYSRTVHAEFQYGVSYSDGGGPTDDDRIAYLQAMLPYPRNTGLRAEMGLTIRWSNAGALTQEVDMLRANAVRQYQSIVDELVRNGRLAPERATTLTPHIDVQLEDQRVDRSVALPTLPR